MTSAFERLFYEIKDVVLLHVDVTTSKHKARYDRQSKHAVLCTRLFLGNIWNEHKTRFVNYPVI